jgi:hypothetical protein
MTTEKDLLHTTRGDALEAAREAKRAEWFRDRKWRVATELTYQRVILEDGEMVTDQGEFWLTGALRFKTPLGHRGAHGFFVVEVDPVTGEDLVPLVQETFGHEALASAKERFGSIDTLPAPRRTAPKRRTR